MHNLLISLTSFGLGSILSTEINVLVGICHRVTGGENSDRGELQTKQQNRGTGLKESYTTSTEREEFR